MIGSLGVPEIIFIVVLALLIFGPRRLPEIGRTIGKGLAEFRRASNEIKRTINAELALEETPEPALMSRRPLSVLDEGDEEAPAPRNPPAGVEPRVAATASPDEGSAPLASALEPVSASEASAEPAASETAPPEPSSAPPVEPA